MHRFDLHYLWINMRRYYFFRHGKADSTMEDLTRTLVESGIVKGKQQARALSDLTFDLVICSEAIRTQQTADILLGKLRPKRCISNHLWQPKDKGLCDSINTLVAKVRGDCLADFEVHDPNHFYKTYAHLIANEIEKECNKHSAETVLIVGHCIIVNAIAIVLAPWHHNFLSNLKLSTAEGFAITRDRRSKPELFLL